MNLGRCFWNSDGRKDGYDLYDDIEIRLKNPNGFAETITLVRMYSESILAPHAV
jgi:hypothetical protein